MINKLSTTQLLEKIGKVEQFFKATSAAFMSGGLVHETACECLLHASLHGDVMPSQRLYLAIGGALDTEGRQKAYRESIIKAESLKAWFIKFSGNQYTARNGTWGLKDKWRPDNFLLDEAEQTPIQAFAPAEQKIRPVYAGQILNQIDNFMARVRENYLKNQHQDNGDLVYFMGDFQITEAALKDISEYAHKRMEQEDDRSLGLAKMNNVIQFPQETVEGNEKSKLIRNGEEVVPEQERRAAAQ